MCDASGYRPNLPEAGRHPPLAGLARFFLRFYRAAPPLRANGKPAATLSQRNARPHRGYLRAVYAGAIASQSLVYEPNLR